MRLSPEFEKWLNAAASQLQRPEYAGRVEPASVTVDRVEVGPTGELRATTLDGRLHRLVFTPDQIQYLAARLLAK